jgi:hypothetical protein
MTDPSVTSPRLRTPVKLGRDRSPAYAAAADAVRVTGPTA